MKWAMLFLVLAAGCGGPQTTPPDELPPDDAPPSTPPPDDEPEPIAEIPSAIPTNPWTPEGPTRPKPQWPAIQTSLPQYSLEISEQNLELLEANIDDRDFGVPGVFTYDGRSWNVEVRYRGRHTRYLPKKSWQIRFSDTDKFHGNVKALELIAAWKDGGMLTEKLWFDVATKAGVRVPNTQYTRLDINGSFYGVFLEIESIRKAFLKAHGFDGNADIFRCGQFDCELRDPPKEPYQENWEKRTNEAEPNDHLWAFLSQINRTAPGDFRAYIEKNFDLDEYLNWLAVDALIANDTIGDSRSFLIFDRDVQRWAYVPWDLNNALSIMNRLNGWPQWPNSKRPLKNFTVYDKPAYDLADLRGTDPYFTGMKPAWSTLNTRIIDDPQLRDALVVRLEALMDEDFTVETIGARADEYAALLAPHLAEDPWVDQTLAANSAQYMKDFVANRRKFLQTAIDELQNHGNSALKIDRVGVDANGTPFVEIVNTSSAPQNLGGMLITGWLRTPKQATAPSTTLAPNQTVKLSGSQLSGFKLSLEQAEVGLFASDGRTAIDTVFLPRLNPGDVWGREPSGSETWKKLQ